MFKKSVSSLVLFAFVFTNIAFADIPKTSAPDTKKAVQITTDPEKIVIPRDYGLIKAKYASKDPGKLVIHIQDAHCNYEAQSNIIKILECLVNNDGLSLISVEGADGFIDTSWFKAFPDADIRKEVADYFMKKGEITGPEFLSITSDLPIKLFGAETRSYYIENLNAFTSSYPLKEDTERYLNQIKTIINKLKTYVYSEEMKELDAKNQDYEAKKLSFTDYVKYLESLGEKHKVALRQYGNLFKLISVLIYEKKIDFSVVDKERAALIDLITKKLDKEKLTELVSRSLEFKVGKISSAEYYDYLRALAVKYGVLLSTEYPNLFNYIIYNSVYSRIENEQLFNDIKKFEEAVKEKLFANDDQRTLEKLSRHINTLIGLVNIKLLNGDFDYYKAHKEEFAYEAFSDFIKKMTTRYGFAYEVDAPSQAVTESMPKLEDFYAIAIKRDKALVDNTIQAMNKENAQVSVLVTGGFHSEGIAKILEKQNISYMVVCPNITKDVETPYIKILTNQRTPLEEILSDTGAADAKNVKGSMLAPILLSRLVGISQERIKVILSEVDGVDKDQLEALIKEIIARERRVERGWESFGVQRWLDKTLMIASERGYAQNEAIMLDAYRGAMEAALISADQPQARAKEIAAAITGNAEFKSAFHILYARLSGGTAVSEPPKDGEKSYPAGASGNEFSEALQKTDNYGRLLDVYGGNERELQRDLLEEAARNKASVVDIVIGRFGDDAKKLRQKLSGVSQTAQGPPDFSSDVLLLSGGSASRLWAPILLGLNPGLSINALVTNVDDGGATQHIINALRENGYGITPPLGDQVNSLFNSFLKADKIFTMLDDSGRIKIGYMGLSEEELLGMSLRDVMAIALRQAKIRDNLFGQALAAMDAGDFEKAGECLEKIKVTLAGIGLAKTSQAVNLDMRYDGAEALLAAALEQRKPRNLESIRRSHERNLSADFLTFSANLLNLADIVDKGIPGFDGKPIFNMKTLLKQNQSIRNLLLLAVLYDEGVFVRDLRLPEGRNAVDTKDKMRRYQMAVNRLAKAVGITNGQVSMSSFKPSVVYARYQDNVLAWWENISLDEKIQRNTRFHTENNGNSLVVTIDQRHGPSMVIRNPDGTDEASRISGTPLIKTLSRGQDILIKTLDSHGNILNAIEVGLDKEGKAYFSLNGDHWVVDESESGDVTYLVKDDKKIRLKNDNPGCGYKDKVLGFNGEGLGALFVPRFIAMQTHVTETVNLSKIVEYGFAEVKEENIVVSAEGGNEVREEHRVFSAPSAEAKSISRDDTNQVAVEMINNVSSGGYILTGPGSFFTSLCSHLLCDGVVEAIKAARARGVRSIFVFNPNEDNETVGLSLSELINFIEKISGAKFAELFDTALISDQVDYIKLLDYDKEYDDLTRKGDYKSDIASRVGIALRNKPDGIEKLGLSVFKLLIDEYIEERSIAVPYGVERYEWAIRNDPELLSRVTAQSAQFATLLFDRIYLTTRAAGDPANMAKKSTAPLTVDDAAVKYLSDSGVDVRRASIYGLVVSINRGDGKAKSSLGYLPELLKVMPLTSEIASMTFEQDISRLASVLKMDKARVRDAVRSKIDTNTLLTNFAESVGIKRTAALKNMAQAGLAEVTGDETYILTDALFSRVLLEKFISIQIKGLRLTDLTPLRLERIILDSVDVSGLIEQLSLTYGKSPQDLVAVLSSRCVFPALTATWYLLNPERVTKMAVTGERDPLKAEDLVRPRSAEFYARNGVQAEFLVPDGSTADLKQLIALQQYQSAVGADMARGGYNYRGTGTKQTVLQFFENYFKPEWYGKIRSFIEQAFGPNGQNLKAIVTNGIGANDQFMWSLIKMYNENKPAGAPVWYHAATAREFARLYSEGKIKPDSTIFVDITRSGATWEGLEVASRSLQEGFNKRIAIVNGGPSKDIAIAAAQARSKTEKTTVAPLVIELSPDIGGRNMHRKTSIYYTVQTIAGIFLPSMDSVEFARLHDKFDRANDFSDEDGSLPVSAGRFLHGAMYLLGAEHIVFMTNTESLRRAGTEWEQYIMEGSNKRDVISMGIHDLADEVYEPPAVLETLVSSPAGKKCVGMALLDRSSPTYDKDRKRVKSVAEAMPVMILTVEGTKITDGTGKVIDVGMTPNQQAALDILWTDLVTVFTSLLRVDANSNPNVKKVREYTSDRVAGWRDNERKYAQDLIGQGKTELLVSSGNPGSPAIGADGKQNAMNTATQARQLGKDIAAQLAGKLKGRDRLNLFVGSEGLQEFVGGLRREAYGSELGRQGWIVQTALFPLWSHKGLEGNLANQAESNTPGPLLGDKTVNIFINTRRLIDNKVTGRGFKNTVDIEVDAGGGKAVEKRQLVPPRKGDGATVEGANVHQTNDAMTMPNIRRMAEVSPTVLFECNEADEDVKALIKAFYESFTGELARLSRAGRDGEKKYPAGEGAGKVTAEQIYQVSTIPERDSLQKYLASLALRGALDNRAVIIAHDTAVAPGQVAQAGERPINKYLEGKLVDIRATGRKLLDNIAQAAQELQAAGIPYKVVTIAGNSTMNEVGQYLTRIGKVLNIQNPDNRYIPIIGLYEVALRIAYDSSIDDVLLSLNRIAINPDNRPFTKDDVEALLSRGVLMILPKIVPVNPSEAAAAYKAAQQALISL